MDSFEQKYWNQKQLLAWVAWGDRRLVQDADDNQEITKRLKITNLGRLMLGKSESKKGKGRWRSSKEKVLCELQQGNLNASGAANGVGDRLQIDPYLWADLDLYFEPDHAGPKRGKPRPRVTRWYSLIFPREEVMALWPDEEKAPPQRSTNEAPPPAQVKPAPALEPKPQKNKRGTPAWRIYAASQLEALVAAEGPEYLKRSQSAIAKDMEMDWPEDLPRKSSRTLTKLISERQKRGAAQ
jgi:hypothetical protein